MKKLIYKSLLAFGVVTFFVISVAFAQAPPPPPPTPPGVPIDGGLSLLAAAGIGYGASRYRKHRKNRRK
ncbi:MAG: hypothetical protein ACI8Q1_003794 [Parvicella sp.]|jgi:hypothetical protein